MKSILDKHIITTDMPPESSEQKRCLYCGKQFITAEGKNKLVIDAKGMFDYVKSPDQERYWHKDCREDGRAQQRRKAKALKNM